MLLFCIQGWGGGGGGGGGIHCYLLYQQNSFGTLTGFSSVLCLFHSAPVFEGAFFRAVLQRFVPPESYVSRMEENFAGQAVISSRTTEPISHTIMSVSQFF